MTIQTLSTLTAPMRGLLGHVVSSVPAHGAMELREIAVSLTLDVELLLVAAAAATGLVLDPRVGDLTASVPPGSTEGAVWLEFSPEPAYPLEPSPQRKVHVPLWIFGPDYLNRHGSVAETPVATSALMAWLVRFGLGPLGGATLDRDNSFSEVLRDAGVLYLSGAETPGFVQPVADWGIRPCLSAQTTFAPVLAASGPAVAGLYEYYATFHVALPAGTDLSALCPLLETALLGRLSQVVCYRTATGFTTPVGSVPIDVLPAITLTVADKATSGSPPRTRRMDVDVPFAVDLGPTYTTLLTYTLSTIPPIEVAASPAMLAQRAVVERTLGSHNNLGTRGIKPGRRRP